MLSSKREYFQWSKQDRMADLTFFRVLHRRWRPTVRTLAPEENFGRYSSRKSAHIAHAAAKNVWTPWLWVGS
jgi:hypothetical protein